MSIYNDVRVSLAIGDLSMIHCAANCLEITNEKLEAREKRNADLMIECERQTKEIDQLRERLTDTERNLKKWTEAAQTKNPIADANNYLDYHDTPFENKDVDTACEVIRALLAAKPEAATTRELQPVTKTAINNAKEALAAHYRPITSEDNLADETVPGDRFHAVYKTLRVLVDCLEQEGLS